MSFSEQNLEQSLQKSIQWFHESGVMRPDDGSWGVGERVLLTGNNEAAEKVYRSFPAWTEFPGYSIIEPRRADCNMETAFMFLLAGEWQTAYNLLDFLYRRSGMLIRSDAFIREIGCWHWSHISQGRFWFDDNAWMCTLQLMIAKQMPEWDREFNMTEWAIKLADEITTGFRIQFNKEPEASFRWQGDLKLPHWGSLSVMALARANLCQEDIRYREIADIYHHYLLEHRNDFTTSEFGYAVLGATMAHRTYRDDLSMEVTHVFTDKILSVMDPVTGNIPAEHYEAPAGKQLADAIYTLNWAVLALQNAACLTGNDRYRDAFTKLMTLLLKIQDTTPEKHLYGCWRGMFDLEAGSWGGGNHYEGGADSIYTGWTNAPITWAVANTLNHKSLLDY